MAKKKRKIIGTKRHLTSDSSPTEKGTNCHACYFTSSHGIAQKPKENTKTNPRLALLPTKYNNCAIVFIYLQQLSRQNFPSLTSSEPFGVRN